MCMLPAANPSLHLPTRLEAHHVGGLAGKTPPRYGDADAAERVSAAPRPLLDFVLVTPLCKFGNLPMLTLDPEGLFGHQIGEKPMTRRQMFQHAHARAGDSWSQEHGGPLGGRTVNGRLIGLVGLVGSGVAVGRHVGEAFCQAEDGRVRLAASAWAGTASPGSRWRGLCWPSAPPALFETRSLRVEELGPRNQALLSFFGGEGFALNSTNQNRMPFFPWPLGM